MVIGVICAVDVLDLPLQTPIHHPETDESTNHFLFFEVCRSPSKVEESKCQHLAGASFLDFPAYYFDESNGSLYTDIAPDPYYIKFNESLRFVIGKSAIGRKSGAWSHLEPVYEVSYSFYLSYSTDLHAVGKIDVMNMIRPVCLLSISMIRTSDWHLEMIGAGRSECVVSKSV